MESTIEQIINDAFNCHENYCVSLRAIWEYLNYNTYLVALKDVERRMDIESGTHYIYIENQTGEHYLGRDFDKDYTLVFSIDGLKKFCRGSTREPAKELLAVINASHDYAKITKAEQASSDLEDDEKFFLPCSILWKKLGFSNYSLCVTTLRYKLIENVDYDMKAVEGGSFISYDGISYDYFLTMEGLHKFAKLASNPEYDKYIITSRAHGLLLAMQGVSEDEAMEDYHNHQIDNLQRHIDAIQKQVNIMEEKFKVAFNDDDGILYNINSVLCNELKRINNL